MRLSEIVDALEGEVVGGRPGDLQADVPACFAADLMSEVLAFSTPGALLVTGLTHVQSVHTADLAELRGIVFVNDKRPGPEARQLAEQRDIPLLTTRLSMFAACGVLYAHGLRPAFRR